MPNYDYSAPGDAELVPGTLRGYRSWRYVHSSRGTAPAYITPLKSVNWDYWWKGGELVGDCRYRKGLGLQSVVYGEPVDWSPDHHAPERGCGCGFYATHQSKDTDERGEVLGVVEAYGRVIVGTKGFRAEKVKIVALQHPDGKVRHQLRQYYKVPLFSKARRMTVTFPPVPVGHLIADALAAETAELQRRQAIAQATAARQEAWLKDGAVRFEAHVVAIEHALTLIQMNAMRKGEF